MHTLYNTILIRVFGAMSLILMPISGAIAQQTHMNGGTMGNGHWYGTGGGWLLPALAIIVVAAVLFAVLRKKN